MKCYVCDEPYRGKEDVVGYYICHKCFPIVEVSIAPKRGQLKRIQKQVAEQVAAYTRKKP